MSTSTNSGFINARSNNTPSASGAPRRESTILPGAKMCRGLWLRAVSRLMLCAMLMGIGATLTTGCKEEKKLNIASSLRPSKMPTMQTRNIATFISDSGVVQYKIVAPLWKIYEEGSEPYWTFPEGIYLQKYDRQRKVIATIAADSAKFFKNKKLWRLDGNVEIRKHPKQLFLTQQLFWDQNRRLLYNDTFTHVETATHMLEGQGFRTNEQFTEYRVIKPTGIFPVENPQ